MKTAVHCVFAQLIHIFTAFLRKTSALVTSSQIAEARPNELNLASKEGRSGTQATLLENLLETVDTCVLSLRADIGHWGPSAGAGLCPGQTSQTSDRALTLCSDRGHWGSGAGAGLCPGQWTAHRRY